MQKLIWLFISAICFIWSSSAIAENEWKQEDGNLRGIKLGSNIYALYGECPKKDDTSLFPYFSSTDSDYPSNFKDVPCYKVIGDSPVISGAKRLNIDNLIFIEGVGREAVVTVIDNRIESIEVEFLNQYFKQIKGAMIEKYGVPSETDTQSFQNSFGQTFLGESIQWNGKSIMLFIDEHRPGDRSQGQIVMSSMVYLNKLSEWYSERTDRIKRGL